MKHDIIEQFQILKAKDKFPTEKWDERGLNPSPDDVREKMNQEVNNFIEFIENRLHEDSELMEKEIQNYFNDWDSFDYDTEETEFMVDRMCDIMRIVDVDCNRILI